MKNLSLLLLKSAFLLMLVVAISSCTKEGPAGPAGPAGTAGVDGSDGTDGVDGNAVCLECHNLANKAEKEEQYAESGHGAGANVAYAGEGPGRTGCTGCHSEQGFVAWQYTGNLEYPDTNGVQSGMPIGCVACHDFHSTFDFENDGVDYALRASDPVALIMDDGATVLDMGGSSNLCVNCHQPRRSGPTDDGTGTYNITSSHWGPHHGPHSTTLEGVGAYELGAGYPAPGSSTHRTAASCTSCHMHEGSGHTWEVEIGACTSCHESATDFDINGVQTDVIDMLAQLKEKFIENGMWDEEADHILPGVYPIDHAGAYYNYAWIVDDRSNGVHNPTYVKTLLINSIAAF
jgi:hypothetical protein